MKILQRLITCGSLYVLFVFIAACPSRGTSQESYTTGPNSDSYEGIPQGKVSKHQWKSKIYPNTIRDYYLYVPSQYNPAEASALMVFQDGHAYVDLQGQFKVPTVFDNLIANFFWKN